MRSVAIRSTNASNSNKFVRYTPAGLIPAHSHQISEVVGLETSLNQALKTYNKIATLNANVSVNNTTTLQTVLSLPVEAGKTYFLKASISLQGTTNTGTRHGMTFPAGSFVRITRKRTSSYLPIEVGGDFNLGLTEANTFGEIEGYVQAGANGNITLGYAQNSISSDAITCRTYTYLTLIQAP